MHLAIDCYEADPAKLSDEALIFRFLDEYPSAIGMNKVAPPQVYSYTGKIPRDWGLSGFVIIAESHVSIHTFPDKRYVNIDIFSCNDFDVSASLEEVKATFGIRGEVKTWTMNRSFDHRTTREAYSGMVQERAFLTSAPRSGNA